MKNQRPEDFNWVSGVNCEVHGSNEKRSGFLVDKGTTKFYLPYSLEDFYNGYDTFVLKGFYWYNDTKQGTILTGEMTHQINAIERGLQGLE